MSEFHHGDPFGLVGPRGELILDGRSARLLNEVRAEIKRLGRMTGVEPMRVADDGAGRRISLELPPTFPAKLSGSGNPYSYVEQEPQDGGGYADLTGGRTGDDAYEANGVAGLADKVVTLRLSDVGDWRFQYLQSGGAPVCARICVTVGGCPDGANKFPVPVAVATISKGAYSESCTVDMVVSSIVVSNAGSGYTSTPTVTLSGGGGSGATATATLTTTTVNTLTLDSGGSNYTTSPAVGFSGGGGTGAAAVARLGASTVASTTVTNGGTGYTSAPAVTLTPVFGTGGTGATATANLTGNVVTSLTITNGGSGYTTAPTVGFSGGGGSGAVATAGLTPGPVVTLTKTNSGSGYSSAPTMTFSGGGGGTGAAATATINTRAVASVTVTNGGTGFTSAPSVAFSGGSGTGAAATAKLVSQCCIDVTDGTGTYDISVDGGVRFATGTTTQVVGACTETIYNKTVNLTVDSDYVCLCNCPNPIAKVLYGTDSLATRTYTWNSGTSKWETPQFTVPGLVSSAAAGHRCETSTSGSVDVILSLRCVVGSTFRLEQDFAAYDCSGDTPPHLQCIFAPSGSVAPGWGALVDKTNLCGTPFNPTFSVADDARWEQSNCEGLPPPLSGPITFTE